MKTDNQLPEIIIRPQSPWKLIDFFDLWRYRELLYIFAWRDIKVKYKQTVFGFLWVIFQPLASTLIFTVFFGKLAKIPSYNLPYSLFVLCGLIFWLYFSGSVSQAANSMLLNQGIIKKIYFPKLILPLSYILTNGLDLVINLIFLFLYAGYLGFMPSASIFFLLPLAFIMTVLTASGLGFLLAAVNVKYRDVNYILPYFIQMLLFITPVIYPVSIVSDINRLILAVNPMSSVVEMIRMVFSNEVQFNPYMVVISFSSSLIIFLFGIWYFKRTELFFADIV